MKQKFYQRIWVKNTILITIPALISSLGVLISLTKELSDFLKALFIISIAILSFILIFAVYFFSKQEEKMIATTNDLNNVVAYYERDAETANIILQTFSELFEDWSKTIYSFVDKVKEDHKISNKAWDKEGYYNTICRQCKNMILEHCVNEDSSNVSVSFVSYRVDKDGEKYVHMIAHSDGMSLRPNEYKKEEKLSESKHYYAELIRREHRGVEILANTDDELDKYKLKESIDLRDCTQYIAIPVYCSNNKLLGIFQVETKYNCIIEKMQNNLRIFATNKIIPYSNLIVLIDKINKGLYVAPKKKQKEE